MPLSPTQAAACKVVLDFRTQIVKAGRQILDAAGVTATGPGEGTTKVPRYFSTLDFERGAATGATHTMPLDVGAGPYRTPVYCEYEGILTVLFSVPYETDEKTGSAYLTEDHARTLDELDATALLAFSEGLFPFTSALLPNLDVLQILPIEPDERPEEMREVNVSRVRFRLRFVIRQSAWPT